MAKYLVTGAAGFIGRSIAAELLADGQQVSGIDNLSTGKRENLAGLEAMNFIEADLNDARACAEACRGVDVVFHEAAIPSVPRSVVDPLATNDANVSGTLQLLVAARDAHVRRIVYAGSSSAYGDAPSLPKHEAMLPDPISPYAVSKLTGEYYMKSFYRVYGLETVTIRYFNVFGPYQDPSSHYSGVLAKFSLQMLAGEDADDFWRRRAEPGLHFHPECRARQPVGGPCRCQRSGRADVQCGDRFEHHSECNRENIARADRLPGRCEVCARTGWRHQTFAGRYRPSPGSIWVMRCSGFPGRLAPHGRVV